MRQKENAFRYRPRDKDFLKRRATQSGGLFDSLFQPQFTIFMPKEGDCRLRILPPTWQGAEHFGLDIFVHYGIGSDNQSYLCANKMHSEICPICQQRAALDRDGDADDARALAPTKRVLVWIINRADEGVGPQLWSMAWTIDRDLATLSIDKSSGEFLFVDDPDNGYDIEFVRTGQRLKTKYSGVAIARRSTPLSDDSQQAEQWLSFVSDNPLPNVLQFYDAAHIGLVAAGKVDRGDSDRDETPTRSRSKGRPVREALEEHEDDDQDKAPWDADNDEDDKPEDRKAAPSRAGQRNRPGIKPDSWKE